MLFVSSLPEDSLYLSFSTQEGEKLFHGFHLFVPVSPGGIVPDTKNVPNVKSKS